MKVPFLSISNEHDKAKLGRLRAFTQLPGVRPRDVPAPLTCGGYVSNYSTLRGRTNFYNFQRSGLATAEVSECYEAFRSGECAKLASRPHLCKWVHGELDRSSGMGSTGSVKNLAFNSRHTQLISGAAECACGLLLVFLQTGPRMGTLKKDRPRNAFGSREDGRSQGRG